MIVLGGWLSDDAAGLLFNWHNAAILEVTLPILHIGLGPSFDRVSIAHFAADPMTTPQSTTDLGFGLDGRVAIVLGGSGPGPHGGLSINLHPHVTFVRGAQIATVMLALGGELY